LTTGPFGDSDGLAALKWACWLAEQPRALAISKLLLRMQKSASPFCGSGAAP
jgi:hypothetical protein